MCVSNRSTNTTIPCLNKKNCATMFNKCWPIFFNVVFSMKFATKCVPYISPHFTGVTPLPGKTQKTEAGNILLQVTQQLLFNVHRIHRINMICKIKYAYAPWRRACRIMLIRPALVSGYHDDVARTVLASCAVTTATKKHSNSCFTWQIALYSVSQKVAPPKTCCNIST